MPREALEFLDAAILNHASLRCAKWGGIAAPRPPDEVWNSDSLMPLGAVRVPLSPLVRGGKAPATEIEHTLRYRFSPSRAKFLAQGALLSF